MKKTFHFLMSMFLAFLFAVPMQAQQKENAAKQFLLSKKGEVQVSTEDVKNMKMSSMSFSKKTGITHLYFQQYHNGIPIHNAILNAHIDKKNEVVAVKSRFATNTQSLAKGLGATITPEEAVRAVVASLNIDLPNVSPAADHATPSFPLVRASKGDNPAVFEKGDIADKDITVRQVYQPMPKDNLRLTWEVYFCEKSKPNWWVARVDAETGELLDYANQMLACDFGYSDNGECHDATHNHTHTPSFSFPNPTGNNSMVVGDAYRIYPQPLESPNHAITLPPADGRTLVVDPADPTASPFGWHDTDGVAGAEFTITRGNNVHAFIESSGFSPDGGAGLNFDFPVDLTQSPSTYQSAAVTNLFYWVNYMHDFAYQYGFDEASGNFQENNYGNGGLGSDYVFGRAQYPGFNNAFFGTPPDGQNPEILMLLWNTTNPNRDGDFDNGVIAHEFGHGISTRLTGGPANSGCLNNQEQMGEGWSDFFSLMTTIEPGDAGNDSRGIGTYVLGQPTNGNGIRPTPYSTDMAINPSTYGDIAGLPAPHGVGYVWATMIWDLNWALIGQHGQTDGYEKCMQLVMDGMKLQPCSPGFVDGRDAILLADQLLYGGENQCLIWEVFARRGLGFSASQGSSNNQSDGVEAFDTPTSCFFDATPLSVNICAGTDADYSIIVGEGFSNIVSFSTTGEPAGTTVTFSPMTVPSTGGNSTMTISNTAGVGQGNYTITIIATDGVTNRMVDVELVVYDQIPVAPVLASPANMAMGQDPFPVLSWQADPNVVTSEVEVATDAAFMSIVASASGIAGTNWQVDAQLNSLTTYYWRVRSSNSCGTGPNSSTWSFETADFNCQNFASADVPVTIETANPNTVTSSFLILECGSILDLNVTGLDISHTAIIDLDIYLTSPSGTTIQLMNRPCGDFDDLLINFDDAAPNGNFPCPATDNGTYQPLQALSAFNGEELAGNWTLTVADRDVNDGGSINAWSLDVCYLPSGGTPVVCYRDSDGDTFGDPDVVNAFCSVCPMGWVEDNADCNDDPGNGGADIFPGQAGVCFDGIDNNCDGIIDENCCPAGSIIYVNASAMGANTGASWADALTDFQTAIMAGKTCANVTEIWVAEGTYLPSKNQAGQTGAGRNAVFYFDFDIEIYGGFPNMGDPVMADRDPVAHPTILSGDIGTPMNKGDNVFTIVYTRNVSNAFLMDGFQLSDGNANGSGFFPDPNARGGAWFNDGWQGGHASPTIQNCMFINNNSQSFGGALYNNGSEGTSSPILINCGFFNNYSNSGSAVYNNGNSTGVCIPVFTNCSFAGNTGNFAPALLIDGDAGTCNPIITNCSFGNNTAFNGGGLIESISGVQTISNSIFWGNNAIQITGGTTTISNSIVQGGFAGTGIFDVDPLFEDAANSNLRLQDCSPAIDAGDDTAAGLVSISKDLDGNDRFLDVAPVLNIVDMGAYEFQGPVSAGAIACFKDNDNDNFGNADGGILSCVPCGLGLTDVGGDCDDTDADTYPGAAENESDTDCMRDKDGDGYGDDNPPAGVLAGTDCEDLLPFIYPGVVLAPTNVMGYQICQGATVPAGEGLEAESPYPQPASVSSSPNLVIPDNNAGGATDIINVPQSFQVTGLTIDVKITHTWVGDLKAILTAPDGTTTSLLFDKVGCSENDMDVTFDDNAILTAADFNNTCDMNPAISGTFQPIEPLAVFNGQNAQGDWKLTIIDNADQDVGTLDNWTIHFEGFIPISWWDAPMGGTQVATGNLFDPTTIPVGNGGVDPNVSGTYSYWAQFDHSFTCVTDLRVQADFNVGIITQVSSTAETCAGAGDGTITIIAVNNQGGQIGYSIDNGTNFQLSNTFQNLTPGVYDVVVQLFGGGQPCSTSSTTVEVLAGAPSMVWYKDSDGDGYSDGSTLTSCSQPTGYIASPLVGNDCNDNNNSIYPGAPELCDGLDNDCDGVVPGDEVDNDGDGQSECEGDCNDTNAAIYTGATEICDGIDNNCVGGVDEGLSGATYIGNVYFSTQAQLDAWPPCFSIIQGNVTIVGAGVTNLGPLANIEMITGSLTIQSTGLTSLSGLDNLTSLGGTLTIYFNSQLTTLDGLDALASVGGSFYMYYNFQLNDCCAVHALINGGVTGSIIVFYNKIGCNSVADINNNCAPLKPVVGGNNNQVINTANAHLLGANELILFPNPASNEVNIFFNRTTPTATLKVLDLLGRVVFEKELEGGMDRLTIILNNDRFKTGLYLVSLLEDGEMTTKQLVVQQ